MVEIQKYPHVRKRENIWKLTTLKSDFVYVHQYFLTPKALSHRRSDSSLIKSYQIAHILNTSENLSWVTVFKLSKQAMQFVMNRKIWYYFSRGPQEVLKEINAYISEICVDFD